MKRGFATMRLIVRIAFWCWFLFVVTTSDTTKETVHPRRGLSTSDIAGYRSLGAADHFFDYDNWQYPQPSQNTH